MNLNMVMFRRGRDLGRPDRPDVTPTKACHHMPQTDTNAERYPINWYERDRENCSVEIMYNL